MTEKRVGATLLLVFIGFMAWAYFTSQQPGTQSDSLGGRSGQPVNEYGRAPKRITDIMAGDGQALREEVEEQRRGQDAPILTDRRRQ
jgi:hypothetical protein